MIHRAGVTLPAPKVLTEWRKLARYGPARGGTIDAEPYTGRRSDGLQYSGLCFDKVESWIVDESLGWARLTLIELPRSQDFVGWGGISYTVRFGEWYEPRPVVWFPRVPFVDEDGDALDPPTAPVGVPLPLPELAKASGVPLDTIHSLKRRGQLVTWRWNGIIYSNRAHLDGATVGRRGGRRPNAGRKASGKNK